MSLYSYKDSLASLPEVYADVSFSGEVETQGIPVVYSFYGNSPSDERDFCGHVLNEMQDLNRKFPNLPAVLFLTLESESEWEMLRFIPQIRAKIPSFSIEVVLLLHESWESFKNKQSEFKRQILIRNRDEISSVYILSGDTIENKELSRAAYIACFANFIYISGDTIRGESEFQKSLIDWKLGHKNHPFSARAITLSEASQGFVDHFFQQKSEKFYPENNQEAELQSTLKHIDEFNEAAHKIRSEKSDLINKSISSINKTFTELSPYIVRIFATADVLAGDYQKKRFGFIKWLMAAAIFSIVCWELYGGLSGSSFRFLALALFASGYVIASWIYVRIVQRNKLDNYFLDSRSLAEAVRVQMQWILIGSPLIASEWYLRRQIGDTRWIQFALNSIQALTAKNHRLTQAQCIEVSYRHWLKKQRQYFNKSAIPKYHSKIVALERVVNGLLCFGVFLILFQLCGIWSETIREQWIVWLIPMTALVPTAAGLINAYMEMEAFRDQINLYYSMSAFFERGEIAIRNIVYRDREMTPEDLASARRILEELGKESLEENSQWLILRRERPLHVFS